MSQVLTIAPGLNLPLDTVTQALAIVAKRRMGKSYLARRFAEQLHHGGQQMVIVDPKGDWWGILSSRDGKGPGLPVVILGGERGHVPLEASGGEVVAKLVVEQRVSVLLDLSELRKHELATFMATFMESLYRLKAAERYRTPLMLIIDEADAVAPQKAQPNETRMLGAAEDIVRRGGQRGIGCMLITQRSAVLNKNVLTQVQILIALRTISPQDIAAMNAWIDVHGTPEQRKTLISSLPALPVGDAWVWSPGWPTDAGIFQRIHTLPIETFDSGATPKPGEKRVEPKRMADVDLDAVREQMAATIERAKADDPKALRKRIAELELAQAEKTAGPQEDLAVASRRIRELTVAVDTLYKSEGEKARHVRSVVDMVLELLRTVEHNLGNLRAYCSDAAERAVVDAAAGNGESEVVPRNFFLNERQELGVHGLSRDLVGLRPQVKKGAEKKLVSNGEIKSGALRMLTMLATFYPGTMTRHQVAKAADMKVTGGTFASYWSTLNTHGFLEDTGGKLYRISAAGLKHLGAARPEVPKTLTGRVAFWKERLKAGEHRLLEEVLRRPKVARGELAKAVGMEASGGTFASYLSTLTTNKLIAKEGQLLKPHPWLLTGADHG